MKGQLCLPSQGIELQAVKFSSELVASLALQQQIRKLAPETERASRLEALGEISAAGSG